MCACRVHVSCGAGGEQQQVLRVDVAHVSCVASLWLCMCDNSCWHQTYQPGASRATYQLHRPRLQLKVPAAPAACQLRRQPGQLQRHAVPQLLARRCCPPCIYSQHTDSNTRKAYECVHPPLFSVNPPTFRLHEHAPAVAHICLQVWPVLNNCWLLVFTVRNCIKSRVRWTRRGHRSGSECVRVAVRRTRPHARAMRTSNTALYLVFT